MNIQSIVSEKDLLDLFNGNVEDAQEAYIGTYDSLASFAKQLCEEAGSSLPKHCNSYEDMGEDMRMGGEINIIEDKNNIHVFWA